MRPKLVSLLAVTAFLLVGCSAAETPAAPTPTQDVTITEEILSPPASAPAASKTSEANEDAFLNELEGKQWMGNKLSEEKLVNYAEDICETLEEGKTVDPNLLGGKTENKMDTVTVLMAAQATMCPETMN